MSRLSEDVFLFPLRDTSDGDIQKTLHCLWNWETCTSCQSQVPCDKADCPSSRQKRLYRYIQYFRQTTMFYEPEMLGDGEAALSNHEDLRSLITKLKSRTSVPRKQLLRELFGSSDAHSVSEREQALDLAVQIVTMVETAGGNHDIGTAESGLAPKYWSSDSSLAEHMSKLFSKSDHPDVNTDDAGVSSDLETMLKASQLQSRAGLKFRPTSNLHDHLKLDRETCTVEIFHYTSFLKEHLRATRREPEKKQGALIDEWQGGMIPRQLALEVLDSIQKIVFPLTDPKSKKILQSLVSKSNFDPDCLRFESASIRWPEEQNIGYHYFGTRLADLHEETQNPKPHGYIEEWLERKSGARYVMLATLFGVLIAVLLGILGLIVSVYQAYIGYMAWKHPVSNS